MGDKRAADLECGDVFRLHVYGEVVAYSVVGKKIKIRLALEDKAGRTQAGFLTRNAGTSDFEFTDEGSILEFLCKPSRIFHVYDDYDDDGDDEPEPVEPLDPSQREPA